MTLWASLLFLFSPSSPFLLVALSCISRIVRSLWWAAGSSNANVPEEEGLRKKEEGRSMEDGIMGSWDLAVSM